MRKLYLLLLLPMLAFGVAHAQMRGVQNLNYGWRFHAGDIAQAASPGTDDSAWRVVDVPHDFQIEQPWVAPGR